MCTAAFRSVFFFVKTLGAVLEFRCERMSLVVGGGFFAYIIAYSVDVRA